MILVAGAQSSGNRMLVAQIEHALRTAGRKEKVRVWHGAKPRLRTPRGESLRIVIPIRSEAMRQRSLEKGWGGRGTFFGQVLPLVPDMRDQQRGVVFKTIAEEGLPAYVFSYEALVRYPDAEGRLLFDWLGLPWVPWHTALYDANEAHEHDSDRRSPVER